MITRHRQSVVSGVGFEFARQYVEIFACPALTGMMFESVFLVLFAQLLAHARIGAQFLDMAIQPLGIVGAKGESAARPLQFAERLAVVGAVDNRSAGGHILE